MAISIIVYGLIGYWIYWSIKHEGIYWIPKMSLAIGSFIAYVAGIGATIPDLPDNLLIRIFFVLGYSAFWMAFTFGVLLKLMKVLDDKIKERMGKDPYG